MAKCTKQILRNNNKEQKTSFTQWEHNQSPEKERHSFRTKKKCQRPQWTIWSRLKNEVKWKSSKKNLNCSNSPITNFNNHQTDAKKYQTVKCIKRRPKILWEAWCTEPLDVWGLQGEIDRNKRTTKGWGPKNSQTEFWHTQVIEKNCPGTRSRLKKLTNRQNKNLHSPGATVRLQLALF